jgi:integrase/recombinase XerD
VQSTCEKLIDIFCEEEGDARYLSKRTVALYSNTLKQLVHWANARQLAIDMLDADQLEQFLICQRQAHAKVTSTFNLNITVLRLFYGFLLRRAMRKDNPARYLRFIKVARSMPPALKPIDIERLLNAPNVLTAQGIADRALLELYTLQVFVLASSLGLSWGIFC